LLARKLVNYTSFQYFVCSIDDFLMVFTESLDNLLLGASWMMFSLFKVGHIIIPFIIEVQTGNGVLAYSYEIENKLLLRPKNRHRIVILRIGYLLGTVHQDYRKAVKQ
jgi:hypothetical protein